MKRFKKVTNVRQITVLSKVLTLVRILEKLIPTATKQADRYYVKDQPERLAYR
jgi:hypothetical protein